MNDKTTTILIVSGTIVLATGICVVGYYYRGKLLTSMIDAGNKEKINELMPIYKRLYENFFADLKLKGYTPLVTSGLRTFAKSQELYLQDSRNAKPGYSLHNYGIACDINIMKPNFIGMLQSDKDWAPIVKIAKKNGLDWGGEIIPGYKDRVHFQPKNFPYKGSELLAMKNDGKVDSKGFVKV